MRNLVAVASVLVVSCGGAPVPCTQTSECGGGSVCLATSACAPRCTTDASCLPSEKCSSGGGCVPKMGCGADSECKAGSVCEGVSCVASCAAAGCPSGKSCGANGHCVSPGAGGGGGTSGKDAGFGPNGPTCGGELFAATRVQANFLIVLDQSGSMEETLPAGGTKWSLATTAIKGITAQHEATIRFGLSMFPGPNKCTEGSNFVPVENLAAMPISMALPPTAKGSGTPIGAALLLAARRSELTDTTRSNFVLLVTDGLENCGGDPVAAVKALATRGIKTYVVGFGSDVDPNRLAQMATEGGTARLGTTKYYQADDQSSLSTSFGQIAAGAAGCDFKLAKAPPDLSKIFVAVDGNLINRDLKKQLGWDYNPQTGRLTLYGGACDVVQKSAMPKVQIVYGCPDPGIIENGGHGDGGYPPFPSDGGEIL